MVSTSILPYMALLFYASLAMTAATGSDTHIDGSSSVSTTSPPTSTTTSGANSSIASTVLCGNSYDLYYVPLTMDGPAMDTIVTSSQLYHVNGSVTVFNIHCGVDFGAGPQYFNPGIHDSNTYVGTPDLHACIKNCIQENINKAYDNLDLGALCTGVSFYGGNCWTKTGLTENAVSRRMDGGGSAILHILE